MLFGAFSLGTPLLADTIVATYEPAGVQLPGTGALCAGTSICVVGTQNFDSSSGGSITTDFGTSNRIVGTYTGGLRVNNADQYGGAGGGGKYLVAFQSTGPYTLSLTTSGGIPGVNYFGLWFSALDDGNLLQFYRDNTLLYSFTPTDFINLVGSCPSSSGFCGNPNSNRLGQNSSQQYAYLNFYDPTNFFNKIVFSEPNGGGGFESDNHSVAYMNPVVVSGTVINTPEANTFGTGLLGVFLLGCANRRSKLFSRKIAGVCRSMETSSFT
jgi:hypothetical protein